MAGIKEAKDVLAVLPALADLIKKCKADSRLDYLDIVHLSGMLPSLAAAGSGLDQVVVELQDLSLAEAVELVEDAVAGVKALAGALA